MNSFAIGFIKQAQEAGFSLGQGWDLLKFAFGESDAGDMGDMGGSPSGRISGKEMQSNSLFRGLAQRSQDAADAPTPTQMAQATTKPEGYKVDPDLTAGGITYANKGQMQQHGVKPTATTMMAQTAEQAPAQSIGGPPKQETPSYLKADSMPATPLPYVDEQLAQGQTNESPALQSYEKQLDTVPTTSQLRAQAGQPNQDHYLPEKEMAMNQVQQQEGMANAPQQEQQLLQGLFAKLKNNPEALKRLTQLLANNGLAQR